MGLYNAVSNPNNKHLFIASVLLCSCRCVHASAVDIIQDWVKFDDHLLRDATTIVSRDISKDGTYKSTS